MFSGLYLSGSVYILRYEISRLAQKTQLPEPGQSVSLQILSLVTAFLDHIGTPMKKQTTEECLSMLGAILPLSYELTFHWKSARG